MSGAGLPGNGSSEVSTTGKYFARPVVSSEAVTLRLHPPETTAMGSRP
jgi:hypothetical protein